MCSAFRWARLSLCILGKRLFRTIFMSVPNSEFNVNLFYSNLVTAHTRSAPVCVLNVASPSSESKLWWKSRACRLVELQHQHLPDSTCLRRLNLQSETDLAVAFTPAPSFLHLLIRINNKNLKTLHLVFSGILLYFVVKGNLYR